MTDAGSNNPSGARQDLSANAMTPKERIDAARSIADFHLARVASRHTIEWRLVFGVWAVLLASVIGIKVRPNDLYFAATLIVATPLFILLMSWMSAKNAQDAARAYYFIDFASAALHGTEFTLEEPGAWRALTPRQRWARWRRSCLSQVFALQTATTVILAVLAFLFAGRVGV